MQKISLHICRQQQHFRQRQRQHPTQLRAGESALTISLCSFESILQLLALARHHFHHARLIVHLFASCSAVVLLALDRIARRPLLLVFLPLRFLLVVVVGRGLNGNHDGSRGRAIRTISSRSLLPIRFERCRSSTRHWSKGG